MFLKKHIHMFHEEKNAVESLRCAFFLWPLKDLIFNDLYLSGFFFAAFLLIALVAALAARCP